MVPWVLMTFTRNWERQSPPFKGHVQWSNGGFHSDPPPPPTRTFPTMAAERHPPTGGAGDTPADRRHPVRQEVRERPDPEGVL